MHGPDGIPTVVFKLCFQINILLWWTVSTLSIYFNFSSTLDRFIHSFNLYRKTRTPLNFVSFVLSLPSSVHSVFKPFPKLFTSDLLPLISDSWFPAFRYFDETFVVALDVSKAYDKIWFKTLTFIFRYLL